MEDQQSANNAAVDTLEGISDQQWDLYMSIPARIREVEGAMSVMRSEEGAAGEVAREYAEHVAYQQFWFAEWDRFCDLLKQQRATSRA